MISSFCSHEIFDVTKPYFSKRGDGREKKREKKKKLHNTLPSPRLVSVKKAAQVRLHKASLPYHKNSRGHLQSLFSSFSSSPSPHPLIIPLPPACTSPTQHLHLPISPISSAFSSIRIASACSAAPLSPHQRRAKVRKRVIGAVDVNVNVNCQCWQIRPVEMHVEALI